MCALNYIASNSTYNSIDSAPISSMTGITVACMAWRDDTTNQYTYWCIADKSVTNKYALLVSTNSTTAYFQTRTPEEGTSNNALANSFVEDQWHHVVCVIDTSGPPRLWNFHNGSKNTYGGTAFTDFTPDRTTVGAKGTTAFSEYLNGRMAELAVWNVVLTDAEIQSLSLPDTVSGQTGLSPLAVRPSSLVFYDPMFRGPKVRDRVGGLILNRTGIGGATVDHPRVFHPRMKRFRIGVPTAVAATRHVSIGSLYRDSDRVVLAG